jgi:hypothetical protein
MLCPSSQAPPLTAHLAPQIDKYMTENQKPEEEEEAEEDAEEEDAAGSGSDAEQ